MLGNIENFCKNSSYNYKKESVFIENNKIDLIRFSIKKLFTKSYNIFVMEENDFNKIEAVLEAIVNDSQYKREYILLVCSTELVIDENENCTYMGNEQIIDCVYYNTKLKQYTYYTDMDTPKCFKQLISYLENTIK